MTEAVIVSAVRTAIGTSRKGSLVDVPGETLAQLILEETVRRAGIDAGLIEDVVFAESMYGGGDLARHAAVSAGMLGAGGMAVNRHCTGSLSAVAIAAGSIRSGMDRAVVAGGVHSSSMAPKLSWRRPFEDDYADIRFPPTHPHHPEAPADDMTITVGWTTAQAARLSREDMDRWALRSHQRAIAAIDSGSFVEEIVPVPVRRRDGTEFEFKVDEHPRRDSSMERLASLKVIHPEIDGFSITAGNSSGINDAASAVTVVSGEFARSEGLTPLARIRSWVSVGIDPRLTGMAVMDAIPKVLARGGVSQGDIALWEINEAFASVPVAACKQLGIPEEIVNESGSGCSIGHPIAASGARMLTTLIHSLRRRGGGLAVAAMCAGGGQAGAMLIEV